MGEGGLGSHGVGADRRCKSQQKSRYGVDREKKRRQFLAKRDGSRLVTKKRDLGYLLTTWSKLAKLK